MFGLGRIRLFRVLGITVVAHWTLLLALLIFSWGGSLPIALLVFSSVLVHEFGHALMARRLGVVIAEIELHFFGGMAKMRSLPETPRAEILIAAAGPATSFIIGAISAGLFAATGSSLLLTLAVVNITLGTFNLLPALPMDGGRIFRAALQTRLGGLKATRIATKVARGLAVVMGGIGLASLFGVVPSSPFLFLLAILLWSMAGHEMRVAEARYGHLAPGEVEVVPEGPFAGQRGPETVLQMLEQLRQQGAQGGQQRRVVMRDGAGRVIIVEQGGYRW